MENILVFIRVRPLNKQEAFKGSPWKLTSNTISLTSAPSSTGQTYNFDRVFGPDSRTADIYDAHTKRIISSTVQGFNGTIFAYGQTSSGKTFTMRGSEEEPGIIPLAIQDVFLNIEEESNREFLLRVSYMEIYNEDIRDLLAPENCKLQVHENFERGIFVAGLREEIVVSPEQVLELMEYGEAHRRFGETNMNLHSSRSHTIFRMVIESRDRSGDDSSDKALSETSDPVRVSHLNLVDLAGSERVSKTGAEGTRLKEGTHINKSLMTLGNVINKLSEGIENKGGHVPYRDSKLTRILQPALGGNAKTLIICNITPALVHVDETRGTLSFASRANRVTNCAQVNEILTDAALLKRQKKEIEELRQKLHNRESPSDEFEEEILNLRNELLKTELERERMALELQEFQKAHAERERRIKEQEQKIENLSTMVINSAVDDHGFEVNNKKGNRRKTWCPRPQSKPPPGLLDLRRPPKEEFPKAKSSVPPSFETLMEEEDSSITFTKGASSSFDENTEEEFTMGDGFSLPEPGPQSFVASRRRRYSNEWRTSNEMEQKLLELEGQYDSLQCEYVIHMQEKNAEIDQLRKELAQTQLFARKSDRKDMKHKFPDTEKGRKSLDAWKGSHSVKTIKQLRSQVQNLETEKLYMQRELERVLEQARAQSDNSRHELEEAYEEVNAAKKQSAELTVQLGEALQQVQQLQVVKRKDDFAFLQLASELDDLKTEVANITATCGSLYSSMHESLQLMTTDMRVFQDCLVVTRDLGSLATAVCSDLNSWKLPVRTLEEDFNVAHKNGTGTLSVELDGKRISSDKHEYPQQGLCVPPQHDLALVDEIMGHGVDRNQRNINDDRTEAQLLIDQKYWDTKCCDSVMSLEQSPAHLTKVDRLKVEWEIVPTALENLQAHIEVATIEKQSLVLRKTLLEEEIETLKLSLQSLEKEKSTLCTKKHYLDGRIKREDELHRSLKELKTPELKQQHSDFACTDKPPDKKLGNVEINGAEGQEDGTNLDDSHVETELENVEKWQFVLRESALQEDPEHLKLSSIQVPCSPVRVLEGAVDDLHSRDTCINRILSKLVAARRSKQQTRKSEEWEVKLGGTLMCRRNNVLYHLEGEVDWAVEELQHNDETFEIFQGAVQLAAAASMGEERLLVRESTLVDELDHLKASLRLAEEEKLAVSRTFVQTQNELEGLKAEMAEIRRIEGVVCDGVEEHEGFSNFLCGVDRLLQEKKNLEDSLGVLSADLHLVSKETDTLRQREASLLEEVVGLRSSLQAAEEERELQMRVGEERLMEEDTQRLELGKCVEMLQATTKEHVDAQKQIMDLKSLLSKKLDEQQHLEKRSKDLDNDKNTLARVVAEKDEELRQLKAATQDLENTLASTVAEKDGHLQHLTAAVEEVTNTMARTVAEKDGQLQHLTAALEEFQARQEQYESESAQSRAEINSLRKELSTAKMVPTGLGKERDSLQKDLEKIKSKLKDIESKLKSTLQDKSKLETEKLNIEREVKHLRQSSALQRDISRRDSLVDQRRQSMALDANKTKNQLLIVEHALQLKSDEVDNLRRDLHISQESYANLEFAMAEAESYSKERLEQLEETIANLKDERDANCATVEGLLAEIEKAKSQSESKNKELENLKDELLTVSESLKQSQGQLDAVEASAAKLAKEKEEMFQALCDSHMTFNSEKAAFTAQAQGNEKRCKAFELEILLLNEELQQVNKLLAESSDVNRLLEEKLQQALDTNQGMLVSYDNQLKQLGADVEFYKERSRELGESVESAVKREEELRVSGSAQLEQLKNELQQMLSAAEDANRILSLENQNLLYQNTKLEVAFDASRGRCEVFEGRLDEADWELTEFKSLLQKAGFGQGDAWNLVSLQQFEKHIKAQSDEARQLALELERMRAQCETYEEKIQYLQGKVLTREQENRLQEIVHQNQNLHSQLKTAQHRATDLCELVKAKEASLIALQMSVESLQAQNTRLEKDLSSCRFELRSAQQLSTIAMRVDAIKKSSSSCRSATRQEKLQFRGTPQSVSYSRSENDNLSPAVKEELKETSTRAALSGRRKPLSPYNVERKRARLLQSSDKPRPIQSLLLRSRSVTLSESQDQQKENRRQIE